MTGMILQNTHWLPEGIDILHTGSLQISSFNSHNKSMLGIYYFFLNEEIDISRIQVPWFMDTQYTVNSWYLHLHGLTLKSTLCLIKLLNKSNLSSAACFEKVFLFLFYLFFLAE